jgi:hypothetical protein
MLLLILVAVFFIICISMVFPVSNLNIVSAQTDVQILSHNGFESASGEYVICGEVENTGTQTLSHIMISADLFDSHDSRIGNYNNYASLNNLPPAKRSPFKITVTDTANGAHVMSYKLSILEYTPTDALPENLAIWGIKSHNDPDEHNKYITGIIRNQGPSKASYIRIIVTYFNSSGNVVYTTFETMDELEQNVEKPFEVDLGNPSYTYTSTIIPQIVWDSATNCDVTAESMEYSGEVNHNIAFPGLTPAATPEITPLFVPLLLVAVLACTLIAKKRTYKKKDR